MIAAQGLWRRTVKQGKDLLSTWTDKWWNRAALASDELMQLEQDLEKHIAGQSAKADRARIKSRKTHAG
jgi:hypothetical protein